MYTFNLQPLLNHRRYQEEVLQKELAALNRNLAREQKRLGTIKQQRRKCARELLDRQNKNMTVSEIQLYTGYLERLLKDLKTQTKRVSAAEKKVELKRTQVVDVMQKRKILEKLKERGRQNYQQKMLKKDRNFMDEVASMRFQKKAASK